MLAIGLTSERTSTRSWVIWKLVCASWKTSAHELESSPNHPELLAYQIKAIDDRLEPLRLKVLAANEGYYLFDPRALSGGDQASQRWVAMARKAGKLLHPHQFGESLHAAEEEKASPLKVIRGGNGARASVARR